MTGERKTFEQVAAEIAASCPKQHEPGAKLDAGKVRPSLVLNSMARALLAVSEVATFGARKYTPDGWQYVDNGIARYTDALDRHRLSEAISDRDDESGLLHAAHLAWNALTRLELILRQSEDSQVGREGE